MWNAYEVCTALDASPITFFEKMATELVPQSLHKFLHMFQKHESKCMPTHKPWDHAINLKDTFKAKKGRLIPLLLQEQEEVFTFIDEQLHKGYICPSKSSQMLPMFFVPKKDGKKQMVQDYHYLNEHMVQNNYPLPLISQLVDKLKGTKMFTKIDLQWGYNNIQIKEGNEWKAMFTCYCGSFKPLVMFFGLCNSPRMFQIMMNKIFADMEDVYVIYIDDLMIFTKSNSKEEHDKVMLEVLCHLKENDLFIKPESACSILKKLNFLV